MRLLLIMVLLSITLNSCQAGFNTSEVCFYFQLCKLEDAIKFEESIGSIQVKDSIFYSHLSKPENRRLYKRQKSGSDLPLYVYYWSWENSESKHLGGIQYFWGPYQGLGHDSAYIVEEVYKYYKEKPYNLSNIKNDFTALAYFFENLAGIDEPDNYSLDENYQNCYSNLTPSEFDNFIKIKHFSTFNSFKINTECTDNKEKYLYEGHACLERNFMPAQIYNSYKDEWYPLKDSEIINYGFMRLDIAVNYSKDETKEE